MVAFLNYFREEDVGRKRLILGALVLFLLLLAILLSQFWLAQDSGAAEAATAEAGSAPGKPRLDLALARYLKDEPVVKVPRRHGPGAAEPEIHVTGAYGWKLEDLPEGGLVLRKLELDAGGGDGNHHREGGSGTGGGGIKHIAEVIAGYAGVATEFLGGEAGGQCPS